MLDDGGRMSEMKKTATKVGLHERSGDFAFWQSQPWTARLEALEEIRREYARWKYGAEQGLQRVCQVVRR